MSPVRMARASADMKSSPLLLLDVSLKRTLFLSDEFFLLLLLGRSKWGNSKPAGKMKSFSQA